MRDVEFTLTVPRNAKGPVPVVIFGHGLVTEQPLRARARRRAGAARVRGDLDRLPVPRQADHVLRDGGVIAVVDPQTGKLTSLPQCDVGLRPATSSAAASTRSGNGNHLAMFPVVNFPVASGAAFIEIDHIANTHDHFQQALVDLTRAVALAAQRRLERASAKLDPTQLYYAGQSLGGIIGGPFVPFAPEIKRAVLNVPGAGSSTCSTTRRSSRSQITGLLHAREDRSRTAGRRRASSTWRAWSMDAVDPGERRRQAHRARDVFLQMATLDESSRTRTPSCLQAISGAPRRDYVAEHAFLVDPSRARVPAGQADMADFLAGKLMP